MNHIKKHYIIDDFQDVYEFVYKTNKRKQEYYAVFHNDKGSGTLEHVYMDDDHFLITDIFLI